MTKHVPDPEALEKHRDDRWTTGDFGEVAKSFESHSREFVTRRPTAPGLRSIFPPLLALLLTVALTSCGPSNQPGQPGGGPTAPPPPTINIDPTLEPPVNRLPGFEGDAPRPIASVADDRGNQAAFVENELWLSTGDPDELEGFLARWRGEIVATFDPEEYNLGGLSDQYLVRIDTSSADSTGLAEDLQELDPASTGELRTSSRDGLNLLAAGASEAAAGLEVGVNWVGGGAQFRDRATTEAPVGEAVGGVAYDPDAFTWPSHSTGSAQDIGVAEAWRALELAGRLTDTVDIAILDMGFAPDRDFPEDWIAISNVPTEEPTGTDNLLWCGGGNDCPWHGTHAVSSAMAVPDNDYGAAGPAGPVADPILVFTLYDFFTSITALGEAKLLGADVANMSYGAPVPAVLSWSVLRFEAATAAFRASGMLLFASAGNEGRDVDAEDCTLFGSVCWERTWYTPCENSGVICVGGLSGNSRLRDGGSNYGAKEVDLYAPYPLLVGPDPDHPGNEAQTKRGTSFSSPFAAGVAALIWAADPSLSAGAVEDILLDTAHSSPDADVERYVNALGAVKSALGNVPPTVEILHPDDGSEHQFGRSTNLLARTEDFEDEENCCTVTWSSSADGALGVGTGPRHTLQHTFGTLGEHTITAQVEDSQGATSSTSVGVTIVNTPPSVEILRPEDGEEVFRDATVLLRGESSDPNEPGLELDCERLEWTSSVSADPLPRTGCELEVEFPSNGPRTLTLTGTDAQSATGEDTTEIIVVDPPEVLPPSVRIVEPADGDFFDPDTPIEFEGAATDPEGASDLEFEWFASYDFGDDGAGRELIGTSPAFSWTPSDTLPVPFCSRFTLEIDLEVTNPEGATGADTVEISTICLE